MIDRTIIPQLKELFFDGKAIVLIGPRQTGKTTLLNELASSFGEFLYLVGDETLGDEFIEFSSLEDPLASFDQVVLGQSNGAGSFSRNEECMR